MCGGSASRRAASLPPEQFTSGRLGLLRGPFAQMQQPPQPSGVVDFPPSSGNASDPSAVRSMRVVVVSLTCW